MTEPAWLAIIINALLLVCGLVAVSVRTTWILGAIKADIVASIQDHAQEDVAEFTKIRQEIDDTARSFGESVAAVRQKIVDVELSSVNMFVRRDGYWKAHEQLLQLIADTRREIREDIKGLETKIGSHKS